MATREVISDPWLAERLPARDDRAHKYAFGRVLVIAGSREYPGAAALAGLGALRAGAGLVRVATTGAVADRMAAAAPELTWLALDEPTEGGMSEDGWAIAASEADAYDAVVIGPGLGRAGSTAAAVRHLVSALRVPGVVDADALNALSEDAGWHEGLAAGLVLTPHAGEFARLVGEHSPAADDGEGRERSAASAAAMWRQVVVLKGARSVVAGPDGSVIVSPAETPALATPGSGDVLAGAIGAFLAAGLEPLLAAACGVGLHAAAGVLCEQRIGRGGVLATDVARLLPEARRLVAGEGE